MERTPRLVAILLAWIAGCVASQAAAGTLDTVNWAPDSTVDGTGTGTLAGTIAVTYTTGVGFDAGETFPQNWANPATDQGTAGATGGAVTYQSGGSLGGGDRTLQTITFSAPVVEPTLLVNYLGGQATYAADVFNFGPNTFSLLSANNAVVASNTVSATTATTDLASDGFGLKFDGTFGPGNPLTFIYSSNGAGGNGLQTVQFTVGIPLVTPEPSGLGLLVLGACGLAALARRRRQP